MRILYALCGFCQHRHCNHCKIALVRHIQFSIIAVIRPLCVFIDFITWMELFDGKPVPSYIRSTEFLRAIFLQICFNAVRHLYAIRIYLRNTLFYRFIRKGLGTVAHLNSPRLHFQAKILHYRQMPLTCARPHRLALRRLSCMANSSTSYADVLAYL